VPAGDLGQLPLAVVPDYGALAPPPKPPSSGNPFGETAASPFAGPAATNPAGSGLEPSLNPYASPAGAAFAFAPTYPFAGGRMGLPWENERQTLGCWFRTMGLVLSSPLLYNVYGGGMLVALMLLIALPIIAIAGFAAGGNNAGEAAIGVFAVVTATLVAGLFYVALLTTLTPLFWAAIWHLMLVAVGGAKQGYETTFRVVSFAGFSALLPVVFLVLVPFGILVIPIWIVSIVTIGLARAHEISTGKSLAAVLMPFGVCCGFYAVIAILSSGMR
jgi:hypothetical protein